MYKNIYNRFQDLRLLSQSGGKKISAATVFRNPRCTQPNYLYQPHRLISN